MSSTNSDELYNTLAEGSMQGVVIAHPHPLKLSYVNTSMRHLTGFEKGELIEMSQEEILDIIHPEDRERLYSNFHKHVAGEKKKTSEEYRIICKDKSIKWLQTFSSFIFYKGKPGTLTTFIDVTEQRKMDVELRRSKEFAENLLETANIIIVTLDTKAVITTFNKYAEEMTGYKKEEVIGKNWFDIFIPPSDREKIPCVFAEALKGMPDASQYENAILIKGGSERIISWSNSIIKEDTDNIRGLLCIGNDVTASRLAEQERKKLENKLQRAQKLETIGTMAGGIAHDFNNILTPIMGYTDMALHNLNEQDPVYKDLIHVQTAAQRAQNLIEQILLFSKITNKERQPVSLQSLIKESLKLLRPTIPSTIAIKQNIDQYCPLIHADPAQIHQVIINLCTNAWQAMAKTGGELTLELDCILIDPGMNNLYPNLQPGKHAKLSVIDNGPGINSHTIDRIFEPFFSTKPVDKGTGLGLSVVHGIIRNHNGDIQVYSEPGNGTVFNIYFPIIENGKEKKNEKREPITGGNERIMVVDDEVQIGTIVKMMLTNYGYSVTNFSDPLEAMKAFEDSPSDFDLLISDLTMPNCTGLDLAIKMSTLRSDFPVIIMTGFGKHLINQDLEESNISEIISKPIIMEELAWSVRKALDKQ